MIQPTKGELENAVYSPFLLTFNEHIHLGPNQSFKDLDVWKHDWVFGVLGQWFQM